MPRNEGVLISGAYRSDRVSSLNYAYDRLFWLLLGKISVWWV